MSTPETKLTLKVMVDSKTKKVIFAEADSDFVDVLLSFLTLPLGTIVRRMNKHFGRDTNVLKCFNNLYSSVENLSDSNFVCEEDRNLLLYPKNALQTKNLKLNVDDSEYKPYYKCSRSTCNYVHEISIDYADKCTCLRHRRTTSVASGNAFQTTVFTNLKKSFIITDDLRLKPGIDGLNLELLEDLASDLNEFEEKAIRIGLNEVMHLLKWSLLSMAPITNLLSFRSNSDIIEQPTHETWAPKHEIADQSEESKIVIKAIMQKSTNKLLFFLAEGDFVGFLFKLLTIPLGGAVLLSGGHSGLGSIDNLYTSVSKLNKEHLISSRDLLTNPKAVLLRKGATIYGGCSYRFVSFNEKSATPGLQLMMDLMCDRQIICKPSTFIVTDDLVVTPSATMSFISHLKSCKVHVSDVKELAINIGKKEALNIFKASLVSSTSVLSNALQLMKQPKQEI